MVKIGYEQTLIYTSEADLKLDPFHLNAEDKEAMRFDSYVELSLDKQKMKQLTKAEIFEKLLMTGYRKVEGKVKLNSMRIDVLHSTSQRLGIPVSQLLTHHKVQGWQGVPKGLLQVLWERGFIDSKMWRHYHRRVLDDNNDMMEVLSLEHLMSGFTDFVNEVSQLKYVCEQLGVRALFTTKYHAEIADEGVKYSWAHSKNLYTKMALRVRRESSILSQQ